MKQPDCLPQGFEKACDFAAADPATPHYWYAYYLSFPDDPPELDVEIEALYEKKGRVCVTPEEVDALRLALTGKDDLLHKANALEDLQEHWMQEFESLRSQDERSAPSSAHDEMRAQAGDPAADSAPSSLPLEARRQSATPVCQTPQPPQAKPSQSELPQRSISQADPVRPS